ncbi:MAG: glycosyltransferase family 2 protein [Chloroflexota bacterium]
MRRLFAPNTSDSATIRDSSMGHDVSTAHPVALSIIIVNWNVWDLLRACLRSIEEATLELEGRRKKQTEPHLRILKPASAMSQNAAEPSTTVEIIVVDNASTDSSVDLLPSLFPWVRLIQSETNLGFTAGNNLGYRHARGGAIYFLNPDTELIGTSLWTLYSALRADPTIGIVGPRLQYGDGERQNNRRRFPTRWSGFWESTWLGQLWPANPWSARFHMRDWPHQIRHDVDWLVGAAMMAKREALEAIMEPNSTGPFDERFFMYSEEMDLCRRVKVAGWRNVFIPHALVIHYEGRSSEQAVARRHIHFNTSKVFYYRKYFGATWANWIRTYLLLEYRCQIGVEQLKYWVGHKPELRRNRIDVYQQVLDSHLEVKG